MYLLVSGYTASFWALWMPKMQNLQKKETNFSDFKFIVIVFRRSNW